MNNIQANDSGLIKTLRIYVALNEPIYILRKSNNTEIECRLKEIYNDGILVESINGIEWISLDEISSWRKKNQIDTPAVFDKIQTPQELELFFQGEPNLAFPVPEFQLKDIDSSLQTNLQRWKDKYDYALKIHEPARMSQEVINIAELAETLNNSNLYYLAGFVAHFCGLNLNRVKEYTLKSLQIDIHNFSASIGLAAIAIQEQDWRNASDFLLWSIGLSGNIDKTSLIRTLGQCILHLKDACLPNIGQLLKFELPDTAKQLAQKLIAFVVKNDLEAYQAALAGNVKKLQMTRIGKEIFPWQDELNPPVEPISKKVKLTPFASSDKNERTGKISAFYPEKGFGFIVETSNGITWFFHFTAVHTTTLFNELNRGEVGQVVNFTRGNSKPNQKYPLAINITLSETTSLTTNKVENAITKKAPLQVRLKSVPRDGSFFAKAYEAEQFEDLEKAEIYYFEEIKTKGKHLKSAIKQLASLFSRKGLPEKALHILKQYQNEFNPSEQPSLDKLRVQFLVKAKRYLDAAKLLSSLSKKETDQSKIIELLRQEAYCFFANNDFDIAISKLNAILKKNPNDEAAKRLLTKIEEAKRTGINPLLDEEEDEEDYFHESSYNLTTIAWRQLENCEFRGLDARSIESQEFSIKDVNALKMLLNEVKGRKPRERADYLLTLAKLYVLKPDLPKEMSIRGILKRHFLALSEAIMFENGPTDVIRTYAVESLFFNPNTIDKKNNLFNFENAWVLLLGTYLSERIESNELLQPELGKRLNTLLERFNKNKQDWEKFLEDTPFYLLKIPNAINNLRKYLQVFPDLRDIPELTNEENENYRILISTIQGLPRDLNSVDKITQSQEKLLDVVKLAKYRLDRNRLTEYSKTLGLLSEYLRNGNFRERENLFLRIKQILNDSILDINKHPTHLSVEYLLPGVESMLQSLILNFDIFEKSDPELTLKNVLDNDFYTLSDETLSLKLQLSSTNKLSPPIESISLISENIDCEPCHYPEPLEGGQSKVVELIAKPTPQQISDQVFTVSVKIEYRTRSGSQRTTGLNSIAVRLDNQPFESIPNPFSRYAGGLPVETPEMFFGRNALIEHIVNLLTSSTLGQCFVLYGQKRSGKSSVLKQIELRLNNSTLFVPLSAGTLSLLNLWDSFANLLLQEIRFRLEDRNIPLPSDFPIKKELGVSPVELILNLVRSIKSLNLKLVIAIDEFTYLYECDKETLTSFMRGWKAIIEKQLFNALLIGQDTMPRFKREFPNEFGVTHDERISYLTEEESNKLASEPIFLNGQSRYRGKALNRLFELTAGSPFFLQIFCDRLVKYLNLKKSAFITEADIEQVKQQLTLGDEALTVERFDGLVTAAGEKTALFSKNKIWDVLTKIAKSSLQSGWCFIETLPKIDQLNEILNDLREREIITMHKNQIRIRVGLFTEWLRTNC